MPININDALIIGQFAHNLYQPMGVSAHL